MKTVLEMDVARGVSIVLTKSALPPSAIPWMENSPTRTKSYRQKKSSPSLMRDKRSKSGSSAKSKMSVPADDLSIVSSIAPHWAKISHIISDNISLKLQRVRFACID